MSRNRRALDMRFDWWETLLIVALVSVVSSAVSAGRARDEDSTEQSVEELKYFEKTYGPEHSTERMEEWMIRDFFRDRRDGYFVDVGANHYRIGNKTYYLETQLGWSGIAIEPQGEFAADWARFRPHARFFPLFVSSKSNETAQLYVLRSSRFVASSDRQFVSKFGKPDEVRSIPTVALTDLLDREGVKHVNFLSIDIELHEPEALNGFDINRFHPDLVCIEALLPVRQKILDFFAQRAYVVVGRYVWVDRENLYFMPLGASAPSAR